MPLSVQKRPRSAPKTQTETAGCYHGSPFSVSREVLPINIFEEVKERIDLSEAASLYGISFNRAGFTNCIFHNDRTPSMKLYPDHFHCFGCGEHGDVVAMTARIFSLTPYKAAQKIAEDFFISTYITKMKNPRSPPKRKSFFQEENRAFDLLNRYCLFLQDCREKYRPADPDEEWHPLFIESLQNLDHYNYYLDCFMDGTKEERGQFISDFKATLTAVEERLIKNEKELNQ